jgi:hypothetical protein
MAVAAPARSPAQVAWRAYVDKHRKRAGGVGADGLVLLLPVVLVYAVLE